MIRNRIIFGILWVLSVVGISLYGGPVSYGLFLMLTSVPLISLAYLLYVFFTYRIYQEIGSKNLIANSPVPYFITLQNEKPILFSGIRVKFYSSFSDIEGIDPDREYELGPKTGIKLETTLNCKYRGEYEVGVKRITLMDFFRLFKFSFDNPEALRVVVKPEYDPNFLPDEEIERLAALENERNPETPDVLTREYMPGDEIKRINWKQTALTGQIRVRRMIGEEKRGILIIPDTCRYSEDEFEYIPIESRILKGLLSLSLYYLKNGIPVTLVSLQKDGLFYTSAGVESDFEKYYEEVSKLSFDDRQSVRALDDLLMKSGALFGETKAILVTSVKTDETEILMDHLRSSGKDVGTYVS